MFRTYMPSAVYSPHRTDIGDQLQNIKFKWSEY